VLLDFLQSRSISRERALRTIGRIITEYRYGIFANNKPITRERILNANYAPDNRLFYAEKKPAFNGKTSCVYFDNKDIQESDKRVFSLNKMKAQESTKILLDLRDQKHKKKKKRHSLIANAFRLLDLGLQFIDLIIRQGSIKRFRDLGMRSRRSKDET